MAGITHETAEARLQEYLDAESKVLTGQSYTLQGRSLTRANLSEIREGISTWDQRCKELSAKLGGRGRCIVGRPR